MRLFQKRKNKRRKNDESKSLRKDIFAILTTFNQCKMNKNDKGV